ncbi:phage protein NinX family protein [Pseudomonas syringae]|uniref:DUF2591 family protein n=1 Tax=Pseudomonas syringae pv. papulans TaxID=83963 RepID=A0A0P9XW49_PSESX|nr:phage protein NinX family protein [Pseudomonas syringae]KPY33142.1 Uncharacterized protein ALO65_03185 [Pseudomonas syringae pv. papulans]KWS33169.1 hypothetical protein AL059_12145 [Pseudomonas syringae pv. papulans]MDH4604597.1 DUF2591 family protein [Pseudomonas syringae pv. papulans]MDH4623800.1 DUF2591 family protein [Pseudomonas syringae pv. papulans]RMN47875.1 hypothetical protein ALQ60_02007 [Pseudomonas syringae pv. papulans]
MTEFVEVKTADLIGAALDWAVAQVEEVKTIMLSPRFKEPKKPFALYGSMAMPIGDGEQGYAPSTCWHCGGPLIEKYKLDIGAPLEIKSGPWNAATEWGNPIGYKAETPLIAACRAIVASVLGEIVSVPKELLS